MRLIVGLGNPGREYHLTPHNLGFMAVDRLARECGADFSRREAQALTAPARMDETEVLLAKPQTYMNLSGVAVARLLEIHGLAASELVVLVDDVALPLGSLRVRLRGSSGGHNGLKSIIGALDSDDFVRIRLGAGQEQPIEDRVSYVLGRIREADRETVTAMLGQACEAVHVLLREGSEEAMNRFNRRVSNQQS